MADSRIDLSFIRRTRIFGLPGCPSRCAGAVPAEQSLVSPPAVRPAW
ncbi:hypothetical protein I553_3386 [Mycobacterium xenopi 4042]|uniref:Uncharacterized protein n=1 Tax=Mycobacterium xenopi 4042 TaxID=1299334 RepID=X8BEK1_MYCXE|nr:hypothetical protein I553_3386 [Mycobacterium xenopi 4042]